MGLKKEAEHRVQFIGGRADRSIVLSDSKTNWIHGIWIKGGTYIQVRTKVTLFKPECTSFKSQAHSQYQETNHKVPHTHKGLVYLRCAGTPCGENTRAAQEETWWLQFTVAGGRSSWMAMMVSQHFNIMLCFLNCVQQPKQEVWKQGHVSMSA